MRNFSSKGINYDRRNENWVADYIGDSEVDMVDIV
jgi:hypothetical protein